MCEDSKHTHAHHHSINSLQTQSEKSHQMKDGSGDLIVNMLKQVECMVVDSLISVKVEDDLQQFDCKVHTD